MIISWTVMEAADVRMFWTESHRIFQLNHLHPIIEFDIMLSLGNVSGVWK